MRARGLPAALLALTTAVAALSGCAPSVDPIDQSVAPIERLGKKAAERVHPQHRDGQEAYRLWGLTAPPAPSPSRPARPSRPLSGSAAMGSSRYSRMSSSVSGRSAK